MQNAYSQQGKFENSRDSSGRNNTLSNRYQHVRGLHLLISVNRMFRRGVGHNNLVAVQTRTTQQQPVFAARGIRSDGMHISFVQRPARWGHYRVSYVFRRSIMSGSFSSSSPIDNYNIWQDTEDPTTTSVIACFRWRSIHSARRPANGLPGGSSHKFNWNDGAILLSSAIQHHRRDQHHSVAPTARPTLEWNIHQPQRGEQDSISSM
jgi:hypothetical protein